MFSCQHDDGQVDDIVSRSSDDNRGIVYARFHQFLFQFLFTEDLFDPFFRLKKIAGVYKNILHA